MPTSNNMQKVLDIQDKNIIFEDHCVFYNIHKQKKCKACEATFTAETPIVKEHSFISNFIKAEILMNSADARSIKSLSRNDSKLK